MSAPTGPNFTKPGPWSDERVETFVGNLLRGGVLLAATVVAIGGVRYLGQFGRTQIDHSVFHGEPDDLRSPSGIIRDAWHGQSRGIIQLGLLLLIATPVARVAFCVLAFSLQRDHLYVVVTLLVLAALLISLFWSG